MSRGINKVTLVGYVGADPETRYMQNGEIVVTLSLATSESWKDKHSGEQKEATEWHRLVLFRRLAEVVDEYVRQGNLLYIEGKLRTRKWEDQNGAARYTTEVVVSELQMLGGKPQQQAGAAANKPTKARKPTQPTQPAPAGNMPSEPPMDFDDDIPFRAYQPRSIC